jgi:hypothetical protein
VAELRGAYEKDEEFGCTWGNHPDLTQVQQAELRAAVRASKGAFAFSLQDMPGYHGELGHVQLKMAHDDPVWSPMRHLSPLEQAIIQEKMLEQQSAGIVKEIPTSCKYACNVTLAAKKDIHGQWTEKRFCVNYIPINKGLHNDKYPQPLPEQIFSEVGGGASSPNWTAGRAFTSCPSRRTARPSPPFGP